MRVLHIFNELKFSGAEIMYANAAPLFQEKGIEMLALSTGENIGDFESRFKSEAIEVHYMKLPIRAYNPVFIINYFKKVYNFIQINKIDVIHIHRSRHFWFFSLVGYLSKKRVVRTVHNVFKHRTWTWIKGYLERYTASKIFKVKFQTIGKSVYENELNYYRNDSTVVNNWYDNNKFFPLESVLEKIETRKKLGIDVDALVIISTGGCSHVKNHHDIIKALGNVNKSVNCIYLHLGQGHTEQEERDLAQELNIFDKIQFLGNKQNVRDYLIASDVYVMPSQFEGLSIAAIEAMACAIPSVLYNSPGLRDLIEDNNNGFLIEPNDGELAKAILQLYYNPKMSGKMGINAYKYVSKNYSVSKGVQGILELYK